MAGYCPLRREALAERPSVRTYPTSLGVLSFPQLIERTQKYAAFALTWQAALQEH